MLCRTLCFVAAVFVCLPQMAMAQWSGGIEGGQVLRDDGTATRLRLRANNSSRPLSHFIYADWIRADTGGNIFEVGYRPRYWFTNKFYTFGEGSVRVDRPLLIDNQQLILGGVGYRLFSAPGKFLYAEVGLGARTTEFIDGTDSDDSLGVLRAGYLQVLSELFRLEFDLDVIDGESLLQTTAEAGISVRIPGGALKYSYRFRRVDPENGDTVEDDDTFLSFSYGF